MGPDKGGDLPGQPAGSIHGVAGLLLLNGEALVADIHLPDEGGHFVEYPAPLLDGQKGVVLFLANDGAGMDAVAVQAQIIERTVQSGGCLGDAGALVMKNHGDDIKGAVRLVRAEVAGFINKYAQLPHGSTSCRMIQKERGTSPPKMDPDLSISPKQTAVCLIVCTVYHRDAVLSNLPQQPKPPAERASAGGLGGIREHSLQAGQVHAARRRPAGMAVSRGAVRSRRRRRSGWRRCSTCR